MKKIDIAIGISIALILISIVIPEVVLLITGDNLELALLIQPISITILSIIQMLGMFWAIALFCYPMIKYVELNIKIVLSKTKISRKQKICYLKIFKKFSKSVSLKQVTVTFFKLTLFGDGCS